MVTYKIANSDIDAVSNVNALDHLVYSNEFTGTEESIRGRYNKNKESFVLAFDSDLLVGYICFFPVRNSFVKTIEKNINPSDDSIDPKEVLPYTKDETHNIYIISIVVHPNYQHNKIGSTLVEKMFEFFDLKIRNNYKISNIYATVISLAGNKLLSKFGFEVINEELGTLNKVLKYRYDDFEKTNVYALYPCRGNANALYSQFKTDDFIMELEKVSNDEILEWANKFSRYYIGEFETEVKTDNHIFIAVLKTKCYITVYKGIRVVYFIWNNIGIDPTYLLDNLSTEIISFDKGKNIHEILSTFGLKQVNEAKYFTTLIHNPRKKHMMFLLAAEEYIQGKVNQDIISSHYASLSEDNIAQYEFSDIYASDRSIVYVYNPLLEEELEDPNVRQKYEIYMLFILEILLLQISAISLSTHQIGEYINQNNYAKSNITSITIMYSDYMDLWKVKKYKYSLPKHLAKQIAERFNIESISEEFDLNMRYYSDIASLKSQAASDKISKSTKKYFTFFTLLSCFSTLNIIVGLIFSAFVEETRLKSLLILIFGILSILTFTTIFFFSKKSIKRIKA